MIRSAVKLPGKAAFIPPLRFSRGKHFRFARRRGVIFVTALWVMLILGVMTLLFARAMRTELAVAHNLEGTEQVNAVYSAAEQYVVGNLDAYTTVNAASLTNTAGDARAICSAPAEAVQVGNSGYFWIIRSNPDDFQNYYYGITDESSKLYLNTATAAELQLLPYMTDDTITDPILDWVDTDDTPKQNGAESDYYMALPRPYLAKNGSFDNIDELLLVKGFEDPTVLYGNDTNHNGVLDTYETASTGMAANGVDWSCGLAPFITLWATQPNTDINGTARVNASSAAAGGGGAAGGAAAGGRGGQGGGAQVNQALVTALTTAGVTNAQGIAQRAAGQTFTSIFDFIQKTGMQDSDAKLVMDTLTTSTSKTLVGMVNVNTAPLAVLQCLPNLQDGDAQNIVAVRQQYASSTVGGSGMEWLVGNVSTAILGRVGRYITGHSYQYSADIVAVTADGQSFKRIRIIVDAQQSPPRVIYRKDMTGYGWPLPVEIRDALRNGTFQPGVTAPGMVWSQ